MQSYSSRLGLSSVGAAVELLRVEGAGYIQNPFFGDGLADGMTEPRYDGTNISWKNQPHIVQRKQQSSPEALDSSKRCHIL